MKTLIIYIYVVCNHWNCNIHYNLASVKIVIIYIYIIISKSINLIKTIVVCYCTYPIVYKYLSMPIVFFL